MALILYDTVTRHKRHFPDIQSGPRTKYEQKLAYLILSNIHDKTSTDKNPIKFFDPLTLIAIPNQSPEDCQ